MRYSVDSQHDILYNTRVLPTPSDVISSLTGVEKIVVRMPTVLRELFLGGPVSVEVYVENVQAGSLKEKLLFRLFFESEENFDEWARKVRQKTGVDFMIGMYPVFSLVLAGMVVFGASYACTRMLGREGGGRSASGITGNTASIINNGVIAMNIDPAHYKDAIFKGAGNMLNVASNACKLIAPAKRLDVSDPSIVIDSNEVFTITKEAIADTHKSVDRSVAEPEMILLEDTEIIIRSLDLDNAKRGWNVIIPSHFEKRIPMEVPESLNMSRAQAGTRIRADIEVYYTPTDEGDRKYKFAYLRNIR